MNDKDNKLIYEAYSQGSSESSIWDLILPDVPQSVDELYERLREYPGVINGETIFGGLNQVEFDEEVGDMILDYFKGPEVSAEILADYIEMDGAGIDRKTFEGILPEIKFGRNVQAAQDAERDYQAEKEKRLSAARDKRNQEPGKVYTHTPKM